MAFVTKVDYSDNRQVKQFQLTNTKLSGSTQFGVTYSALTGGVDESTVVTIGTLADINSTFSGNSQETIFFFGDSRMNPAVEGITPITDENSGDVQTVIGFEGNDFIEVDGNIVYENYTGVTFDLTVTSIREINTGEFTGTTNSQVVTLLSGSSLDFSERTIWVDVKGITRSEKLILVDEPALDNSLSKVLARDSEGEIRSVDRNDISGVTYNELNNTLTLERSGNAPDLTTIIPSYSSSSDDNDYVTGATINNDILEFTRLSGGTFTLDLNDTFIPYQGANSTINLNQQDVLNVDDITANSFITDGGNSNQFVKGDGSLDSTSYVTGTTTDITNWNEAYADKINSISVSGTTVKTITLTTQSGDTLSADFNDTDTTYTAGGGLTLVGTEFSHDDTSSQNSSINAGRTYIQSLEIDDFGHITGLSAVTETTPDTTYDLDVIDSGPNPIIRLSGSDLSEDDVNLIGGSNVILSASGDTITIESTDTDTTYTAGDGIILNNTEFSHDDTSSLTSTNNSNRTYIQNIEVDGFGHITGVTTADETLVDTNDYVNDVSFNTSTGEFTLTTLSGNTITENLDGRYLTGFTDTNTTYTAGDAIDLIGTEFNHADTSSQNSTNNSGRTYIQNIELDDFGHITGLTTASETFVNTNTTYNTSVVNSGSDAIIRLSGSDVTTDDITLVAGNNITLTPSGDDITIESTNTDTTYTAGDGINLVGTEFNHDDTSTETSSVNADRTYIQSIELDDFGHITNILTGTETVVNTDTTYTAGGGIDLVGAEFSHADTSTQGSSTNGGRTYIQTIELDDFGHITDLTTSTETVVNTDTNTTYATSVINSGSDAIIRLSGSDTSQDDIRLIGGSNVILSASGDNITIESTDTNTTYTAGDGIILNNTEFSHDDTSSLTSTNNSNRTYIQNIEVDGFGHITGVTTASETVVDTDTTYTAGDAISLVGTKFNHADTSSLTSTNNSNRTYIQNIEVDDFGHITGLTTADEIVINTDTNTTYTAGNGINLVGTEFSHEDTSSLTSTNNTDRTYIQNIEVDGFGHITGVTTSSETVVNTDTNTTYTAGDGINLVGTEFNHEDTSSLISTNNTDRTYIQNIEVDDFGHITGVTTGSETVVDTTYTAGDGINLVGTEFSHEDTSSLTSTNNTDRTYIQNIEVDDFGHITGVTTGSETVTNTDTTYTAGDGINLVGTEFSHEDTSSLTSTNNSDRTYIQNIEVDTFGHITGVTTSSETVVDTTYAAGDGINLVGTEFSHDDTSSLISTNNTNRTYIQNIEVDDFGHITGVTTSSETVVNTDTDTTYTAGNGIILNNTEFSHDDTSSLTSTNNSDRTYIQNIEVDDFGHITGVTTASETVVDTNTTYTAGDGINLVGTEFNHEDTSSLASTNNSNRTYIQNIEVDDFGHITGLTTADEIVINTDTTYTAGNGINLVGTEFSHEDTSSLTSTNNTDRTYIQNIEVDDFGHITGVTTGSETVVDTTYTAGDGINLVGTEFNHEDTSSLTSTNNTDRTYIQNIEVDTFGHITGVTTGSETVVNTDTTYTAGDGINLVGTEFSHEDTSSLTSTNNSNRTYIQNIEVDTFGHITGVTTSSETVVDTTYAAGDGINLVGTEFNHDDTSSLASTNNSNRTYIQNIEVDGFGHITGVTTSSETVVDTNTTYTAGDGINLVGTEFSHTDTSSLTSTNNTDRTYIQNIEVDDFGHITGVTTSSETVVDTTYAAGDGINLVGTEFSHEDTSSLTSTNNSNRTYIQNIEVDGFGHITGVTTGSETVVDTTYTAGDGINLVGTEFNHDDTSSLTSTNNSNRTYIQNIEVDDFGHITGLTTADEIVINTDTTYIAGDGINLVGTEFSHEDTSSLASTNNSNRTYIQNIEVDTFGHITGVTTGSETVVNTNTTYTAGDGINLVGTEFSHEDTSSLTSTNNSDRTYIQNIEVDGFGHITGVTTASETVVDTNTTYTAGDGINLVGTEFNHDDTSSLISTNNSDRTYIQNIEVDDFGHITGVTTASETVINTDTNTTYTAGDGINLVGTEFNHEDTSSLTSTNNSDRTYIQNIEVDDFGHITGVTTASETVVDTDTTYTAGDAISLVGTEFNHADTSSLTSTNNSDRTYIQNIEVDGFGHITGVTTGSETVVNTDTNTTYTAGNAISLVGTEFNHEDTSSLASTNNSDRTYIQNIEVDGFGHITGVTTGSETVVNTDTTYTAGDGINLVGTEFNHEDTSSLASTNNTDRTYIQNIEVDGFGHITGVTTGSETVVDSNDYVNDVSFNTSTGEFTLTTLSGNTITESLDGRYLTGFTDTNTTYTTDVIDSGSDAIIRLSGSDLSEDDITLVAGNNITLTPSGDSITIESTDTNTTYTAGDAIDLVGTEFNHADTSSLTSTNNSGRTYIQNIELDDFGHITDLTTNSETVVNTDTNTTYNLDVIDSGGNPIVRLNGSDATNDDIRLIGGSNVTLSASGNSITINGISDDTTYTAGDGINLVGTEFNHDDTSSLASTNNSDRTYIQNIEVDGFGHITGVTTANETVVNTDTNTTYTAGDGINLVGTEFNHSDTSSLTSTNNSNRTYIQNIEVDTFGHITGVTTGSETVINTDTTYTAGNGINLVGTEFSHTDTSSLTSTNNSDRTYIQNIEVDGFGHITGVTTSSETVVDTTYTAGDGINLVGTEFNHADTSSLTSTNNSDRTYIQNIEVDGFGHITGVTTADETVVNTDTTYTAGDGINLVGTEFNHEDTSSLASTNNSDRTYIQNIEVDTFGHITGVTTSSETVVNTNTTYTAGDGINLVGTEFNHEDTSSQSSTNNSNRTYIQNIEVDGFGHITGLTTADETVVNTDTTYTAGDGINLVGAEFNHADTSSLASTNNSDRTYIQNIEVDDFGHITDLTTSTETVVDTTYTAGNGINLVGTEFSHTDTSSLTSTNNSDRTYIQNIEVDDFGHITGVTTSSETVVDTNDYVNDTSFNTSTGELTLTTLSGNTITESLDGRYLTGFTDTNTTYSTSVVDSGSDAIIRLSGSDATNEDITLVAGPNIVLTPVGDNITIESTDTNTTYTAGDGINLVGTEFNHEDTSSLTSTNNSNRTYIQNIEVDGFGHITGVTMATETVVDTTYTAGDGINLVGTEFNHADTSSLTSTNNSGRTYIQNIEVDGFGHITDLTTSTETVVDTTYTAGNGINLVGTEFSHEDTSSLTSTNNSDRTYIQNIEVDTFGHITGVTTSSETVVDTNDYVNDVSFNTSTGEFTLTTLSGNTITESLDGRYLTGFTDTNTTYTTDVIDSGSDAIIRLSGSDLSEDDITLVAGSNIVLTPVGDNITIESTDTDTTYTAGDGLELNSTEFSHADTSSQNSTNNSGRTYIQNIELDDFGHITGVTTGSETVVDSNDYVNDASFNASTGDITLTTLSGNTVVENLDGRYLTEFTDTNTTYATSVVNSGSNVIIRLSGSDATTDDITLVAGNDITLTPSGDDITIESTSIDTNFFLNGLSFDTGTGVLTASVSGTTNQTIDLDGRYLTSYTETDTLEDVTSRGNSTTENIKANSFITNGGNSNQFVKGDGSLDGTDYLPISGGILTGGLTGTTIDVDSVRLEYQENLNVDSATTEVISTINTSTADAAFFDYVIKKGLNLRAGTVMVVHDGTNVEFTDNSTNDLGDTSDVTFDVDLSGGVLRLLANTTSDDWRIKVFAKSF